MLCGYDWRPIGSDPWTRMDIMNRAVQSAAMPRVCVYCGADGPLTGEHLLNAAMCDPSFVSVDTERGTRQRRMFTLRDVCAPCNNVRLSWLDRYAADLDSRYFRHLVTPPINVAFYYNFRPLVGFLTKWAFNTARFGKHPTDGFKPLLPFLLGDVPAIPAPVVLYFGIIAPTRPTLDEKTGGPGPRIPPNMYACGPLPTSHHSDDVLLAYVHQARAYYFTLIWWRPGTPRSVQSRDVDLRRRLDGTLPDWRGMYKLRPSYSQVRAKRPCMNFEALWQHHSARLRASRRPQTSPDEVAPGI